MLEHCLRTLFPAAAARCAGPLGFAPARGSGRGDVYTKAAFLCAGAAGMPAPVFADKLAALLAAHPNVASAQVAAGGFVNLTLREAALDQVLPTLLRGRAPNPPQPPTAPLKLCEMRRDAPVFMVQYAHARCHSVLRAAASVPELAAIEPALLAASPLRHPLAEEVRCLLCRLDHWLRLAPALDRRPDPHAIRLFLRDLSDNFDRLWKHAADGATLRLLDARAPARAHATLALLLALSNVIRAGLSRLGLVAAEEIR